MKKRVCCILLAVMPLLCGCSDIYSKGKDVGSLIVIDALGADAADAADALLRISLVPFGEKQTEDALFLCAEGETVTQAEEYCRESSDHGVLFFHHISHVLLGAELDRDGLHAVLDHICRSPEILLDVPMFRCIDASAEEVLRESAKTLPERMLLLRQNAKQNGDFFLTNASALLDRELRGRVSLLCALSYAPSFEQENGEEAKTLQFAGYELVSDGERCGFFPKEDLIGVLLLGEKKGRGLVSVTVEERSATFRVTPRCCRVSAVRGEGGQLTALSIDAEVSCDMADAPYALGSTEFLTAVSGKVNAMLRRTAEGCMEANADVFDWEEKLELSEGEFALLSELPLEVRVTAKLLRTDDWKEQGQ